MSETLTFFVVKGTLVLLVASSALMWALVVVKLIQGWRVNREDSRFTQGFGRTTRLPSSQELTKFDGPVARVALAGAEAWEESSRTVGSDSTGLEVRRDLLERSLRQQLQRERRGAEAGLPVFASIGSTAPFVGLFGTVLGIIHALQRISGSGSASLDVVAGPIGEALVATGIGIAVAVPAVLAYNYFVRRLKSRVHDLEDFANSFVNSAIKSTFAVERDPDRSVNRPRAVPQEVSA
ncbi:MAG: MotA/TolQ/ExbB proton channel family protein [Polyangiaceae bacterium]|jgi:biopolymer transport protein ExbB